MSVLETSFIILSMVFLVLVVLSAPFFWQMWRAAKNMATALETLNQSLPEILKNLEDISKNISSTTIMINKEVEGIAVLGNKIRAILEIGATVEHILRRGIKPPLLETYKILRGVVKGVNVFFDVLSSKQGDSGGGKGPCQR